MTQRYVAKWIDHNCSKFAKFSAFFFNQNTKFSDSFFPSSQSRPKALLRMTYVRSQKAIQVRTRDGEYSPITLFY